MKTIIFSLLILSASLVKGQTWTTFNYSHENIGQIYIDSVSVRYPYSNASDSIIFYYSNWQSAVTYYFFNPNFGNSYSQGHTSQNSFPITYSQLDSCSGKYTYRFLNYDISGTYQCGIGQNAGGFSISPTYASVTTSIQPGKAGTVTIYDVQGRFIKTSPVSQYTQGLALGTLYIYKAVYSDNTFSSGKFIIE